LDFLSYYGALTEEPMPELTLEWLNKVPLISIGVTGLMTGLFWVIGRRMQAEAARKARENQGNEVR
jgi:hypothetical protein